MPTLFPKEMVASLFAERNLFLKRQSSFRNGFKYFFEYRPSSKPSCPVCEALVVYRYGKATVVVRDQPISTTPIWLEIIKHRYRCKSCQKVFSETIPGIGKYKRFSFRFQSFLAQMCEEFSSFKSVQKFYNCSSGLLYKLYYAQQEKKMKEKLNYPWPEVIGIDEHFFSRRKGYTEFATVITDIRGKRVYEIVEGKNKMALSEALSSIPGRERVKIVAMDMSSTFRSFVKEFFPNAQIVADKFHVLRLLNPALIKLRKALSVKLSDTKYKKLMLKNRNDLEYFQRSDLDCFLKQYPELDKVYRFKERLYELYRCRGVAKALKNIHRLINDAKTTGIEALTRLAKTLHRWRLEIVFHFDNGLTNAITEAFNKTAKLVQRRACGFKSFKNYRLRVLSACS